MCWFDLLQKKKPQCGPESPVKVLLALTFLFRVVNITT